MSISYSQARTDFRCAICQRKNVFHCEHDTPNRDRFLGTSISDTSQSYDHQQQQTSNNEKKVHQNGYHTSPRVNSNPTPRYQQDQRFETKTDVHMNGSSQTHEQKKKSKSCVIL